MHGKVQLLVLLGVALAAAAPADAAVVTARGGLWSDGGTWVGGSVPGGLDDVVIASGHTVTNTGLDVLTINSLSVICPRHAGIWGTMPRCCSR